MTITPYESPEQALQEALPLPYAYIRQLSGVYLGPNPLPISLDGLTEARFFGADQEIRLLDSGDGLTALKFADDGSEAVIDTWTALIPPFGRQLRKRQYIAFDPDGQAYISATRLAEWKEG